tara:strand:- start:33 stop:1070 length:1038 start_codon:yes stop_codon:yes gene_type:complete
MGQREKERKRRGKVSRVSSYTGFPINTQQFIQPQRSAGIPMGGSRTTTGPAPQFAQQSGGTSGGLEGLLAAKEGYDQIGKAYKGGENISDWYSSPGETGISPQENLEDTGNMIRDMYTGADTFSNAEQVYSTVANAYDGMPKQFEGFSTDLGRPAATPTTPPQDMGLWQTRPVPQTTAPANIGPGSAAQASYNHPGVAGVSGNASQSAISGLSGPTSQSLGSAAPNFGQGLFETGLAPDLSSVPLTMPTDTLQLSQGGVQAGAEATAEVAAAGGTDYFGGAAAAAGLGLNAYDISQQGATFGNMTGLIGSGVMAGTTLFGLSQAWNPVGWTLLGASAVDSIFDIF